MSHTNKSIRLSAKLIILSFGLMLAACGGGGGGGDTTYPSIQYSGNTNKATVDSSNAEDFPVTFLEGSAGASEANPYSVATDPDVSKDVQHIAVVNIVTEQIKNNIINNLNLTNSSIASGVTQTYTGTCPANPGSYTDNYVVTSTGFSGTSTFNYYCVGDSTFSLTMYGKINYNATYVTPVTTPVLLKTFSFDVEYLKLTLNTGTESFSEEFSGSVAVTYDGSGNLPSNITNMTISTTFKASGLTYKIVDLQIDTASGLAISGTFYHPVHGYVDVSTPAGSEFTLVYGDPDKYCGGVLEMVGNDSATVGTAGATNATIEFEADSTCSNYKICVRASTDSSCLGTAPLVAWP
jgi:hypothetical protein